MSRTIVITGFCAMLVATGARGQTSLPIWRLAAEPRMSLGVVGGDSLQEFGSVVGARYLPQSDRVVIADRSAKCIREFGTDGTHVQSFGREGRGPGEFASIDQLYADPETVSVLDWLAGRVSTWTHGGELVSTVPMPRVRGAQIQILDRCDDGALLVHTLPTPTYELGLREDSVSILRIPAHAAVEAPFVKFYWQQVFRIETGQGTTGYPAGLAPRGQAVCAGDGFWYSNGRDTYIERVSSAGNDAVRVDLPITIKRLTDQEKDEYGNNWVGSVPVPYRPRLRSALRQMPFPRYLPATNELFRSGDGDIWVAGSVRSGEESRDWIVVSSENAVVARVEVAADLQVLDAGRDFLLVKQLDELDVQHVLLFDLER